MVHISLEGEMYELAPSKIVCLLRNYAAHARELSNPVPQRPRYFLKPPSSLIGNGGIVRIPDGIGSIHHEVELALIIGERCRRASPEEAEKRILAYTVVLDITARDLQDEVKSMGLPWSECKGFDTFAPVGPVGVPAREYDWRGKRIWLSVNGETRQDGNTDLMLFSPGEIISEISGVMTLEPGDIILTGTPSGVGPLSTGDRVDAGIDGIEDLYVTVE